MYGGSLSLVRTSDATLSRHCRECVVRHLGACQALSDKELARLEAIARPRRMKTGQVILPQADKPAFFANIISGVVKLTQVLHDGRQQIVGLKFASDFLGRFDGAQNPCSAEAATDVELCCFPLGEFRRIVQEHPKLERLLLESTLNELDDARDWMVLLGRKNAREKMASFFEMIARRTSNAGCVHCEPATALEFVLPLTRADIADYLGLTLETVSRQIACFKAEGIISMAPNNHRHVIVPDWHVLEQAANPVQ